MHELELAFTKIPLFQNLPLEEKQKLLSIGRLKFASAGKFLTRAGQPVTEVSFILEGGVRLSQASSEGKEVTIALLGPGAHIGVVSSICDIPRNTDVIATSKCSLLFFEASQFLSCLATLPSLAFSMVKSLSQRLNQTSQHLAEHALYELNHRLVLRLLEIAEIVEWDGEEKILVRERPSHQELAHLLGVSREAISRSLKYLEDQKHISVLDDQIIVISTPLEG